MKHTPTPWEIAPAPDDAESLDIVSEYKVEGFGPSANWIAGCDLQGDPEENRANAEFIVRACNSHEELLEALLRIQDQSACGDPQQEAVLYSIGLIATAAIGKAEGRG